MDWISRAQNSARERSERKFLSFHFNSPTATDRKMHTLMPLLLLLLAIIFFSFLERSESKVSYFYDALRRSHKTTGQNKRRASVAANDE